MKFKILLALLCLCFSAQSNAKLYGHNVVYVHGFDFDLTLQANTNGKPSTETNKKAARDYWKDWMELDKNETFIYWPSWERIDGKIKDVVKPQIKKLEKDLFCKDGCIFVTHSTGDLVVTDIASRLGSWDVNPENFKILMSIDLAGAGGGTELANTVVNIQDIIAGLSRWKKSFLQWAISIPWSNPAADRVIKILLGVAGLPAELVATLLANIDLGVVNDLQTSEARARTRDFAGEFPRLRYVGERDVGLQSRLIPGRDDGVVPMHSACGSADKAKYTSCTRSVSRDGWTDGSQSRKAPTRFFNAHYPMLVGNIEHNAFITSESSSDLRTKGHWVPQVDAAGGIISTLPQNTDDLHHGAIYGGSSSYFQSGYLSGGKRFLLRERDGNGNVKQNVYYQTAKKAVIDNNSITILFKKAGKDFR